MSRSWKKRIHNFPFRFCAWIYLPSRFFHWQIQVQTYTITGQKYSVLDWIVATYYGCVRICYQSQLIEWMFESTFFFSSMFEQRLWCALNALPQPDRRSTNLRRGLWKDCLWLRCWTLWWKEIKLLFFLFSDGSCTMLSGQESDHLTILLISRWELHNAPQPRAGSFDVEQMFYHFMYCT